MGNEVNQSNVILRIADESDLEKFKTDLQEAFKISAEKEFCHTLDEPIPSDLDIDESFKYPGAIIYQFILNDNIVGGAVISIDEVTQHNKLLLFFVLTSFHNKGVGYKAWKAIEEKHNKTKVWETVTPYFEKRNIHFYVNKCRFKIVDFFNKHYTDQNHKFDDDSDEEMFRLEKQM